MYGIWISYDLTIITVGFSEHRSIVRKYSFPIVTIVIIKPTKTYEYQS